MNARPMNEPHAEQRPASSRPALSAPGPARRAHYPSRRNLPGRPSSTDPARRVAFEALSAVRERDAYANLVLPALLREHGLSGRDAALATELTYGTLRGLGTYDAILGACVDRPLEALDPPLLDVLRLGAHQLLATRVPPHAAVSATVALAREVLTAGPARLANAVLRRVAGQDLEAWLAQVAPLDGPDPDAALAVRTSHPTWIVRALRDALVADGRDPADLADLLAADNVAPRVMLAVRPGRGSVDELVVAGGVPGRWSPWAVELPGGDPGMLAAVRTGRAGVQDEGSQLLALAVEARRGEMVVDFCAGAGGKTLLLGAMMRSTGRLYAFDVADKRLAKLKPRMARAGLSNVHPILISNENDIRVKRLAGKVDRVLVDAPCSGLGTLRRNPDLKWRQSPQGVDELIHKQTDILTAAARLLKPGGRLVYATCSILEEENAAIVDAFLATHAGFHRLSAQEVLAAQGIAIDCGEDLRLSPHKHGTDGFYAAVLERVK